MSDPVVREDEVSEKPVVGMPYQSVWMAHWGGGSSSSCTSTNGGAPNKLSLCYESGVHQVDPSGPSRFTEVSQLKTFEFMSEKAGLGELRSKNLVNCGGGSENVFVLGESGMVKSRVGSGDSLSQFLTVAPCGMETRSRESRFQFGSIGMSSKVQGLRDRFGERDSSVFVPLEENVVHSTSGITPFRVNANPPFQPLLAGQDDIDQPSENAPFWVHKRRSNRSGGPSLHDPSSSNIRLRDLSGGCFEKMPSQSGVRLLLSGSNLPRETCLEKVSGDGYGAVRMIPSSLHDVETMRVYATIDTVQESLQGPPTYSRTTRQLFITEKTDVNISDGGQMFRESIPSDELKGKAVTEFHSSSPAFSFRAGQGLTLKPWDSCTESAEKEILNVVKNSATSLMNESSAETDTMDMDAFRENNLSGVVSSLLNKDVEEPKLPTSQALMPTGREESRGRIPNTDLPDMNQEFPAIPGVSRATDDNETSVSRTQSLDVERIISHGKNPINLPSDTDHDCIVGVDPCSRWIKRLKPTSSDSFAYGTKSSTMVEVSPHRKVSKFFNGMLKCSKSCSEPKLSKSHDGEMVGIDQTAVLQKSSELLSGSSAMESRDRTLLHAWIQRWCRNGNVFTQKKHDVTRFSETHSSKETKDSLQEKQLPSVAAMALMGKAMNGLRPCEVRKRGAVLIWNTKGD